MSDPESEAPLSRIDLLRHAQSLGVSDADVMTRAELRAAIESAQRPEPASVEQHPSTWVGVARRLLARVVERGLNLPDAAALIRGDTKLSTPPKAPPPVATVTLARIYAAQGHLPRAITTLDEVLKSDPDHELARELRVQLELRREELRAAAPAPAASGDADAAVPSGAELPAGDAAPESLVEPLASASPPNGASADEAAGAIESAEPVDAAAFAPVVELAVAPAPEQGDSAAGELVAPAFDVVERASEAAAGAARAGGESPAGEAPPSGEPGTEPPASAPYTEPPTMVGSRAPLDSLAAEPPAFETPSGFPDTEPPATIAVGFAVSSTLPPEPAASEPAASEPAAATLEPAPVEGGPQSASNEPPLGEPHPTEPLALAASNGALNGIALGVDPSPTLPAGAAGAASEQPELPPLANGSAPPREPLAPLPDAPGLVLIETDSHTRYLYWEVAAAGQGSRFWIHVVLHVPGARGEAERRERRFPVYRRQGALRLEGVPAGAVVRARLTGDADEGRSLVVAGAVKPEGPGAGGYHASYAPFAAARPELIAQRAAALLERASPVYWD